MPHGATHVDPDLPVSRSRAASKVVNDYLRSSCPLLLEALGRENVAALIVSGSATLEEVTAVSLEDGQLLVLSDVDLGVVMKTDALRDKAKRMRRTLMDRLSRSPAASALCASPELGVYSLHDLEIQSRKMGVFEIATSGRVLWGDEGVLRRMPSFRPDQIAGWEAVVLLFNRCLEQIEALEWGESEDPRDALRLLYAGAKSFLDAGTSIAAYHGCYEVGYRSRLQRIKSVLAEHRQCGSGSALSEKLVAGLSFWTDFKVEPDLVKVAGRYGANARRGGVLELALNAFAEARVPLLETWMALLEAEGVNTRGSVLGACRSLVGAEPALARLRGWKQVGLAGGEVPLGRALRLAAAGTPLHLLRLCGICLLDQYGGGLGKEAPGRVGTPLSPRTDARSTGGAVDVASGPRGGVATPGALGGPGSVGEAGAGGTARAVGETGARGRTRSRHWTLDEQTAKFLWRYCPAPPPFEPHDSDLDRWRRHVVDVWRRWTERFWS